VQVQMNWIAVLLNWLQDVDKMEDKNQQIEMQQQLEIHL
jgi:hypothetical protein